jgi:HK97 family phage prohead protease
MPKKNEREYRDMMLAVAERAEEETEEKKVEGYATTFNEPYVLFEDDEVIFREQVDPSAFDNTDMSDVIMQYDHEGRVFARTGNNTLTVTPDEKGLFITADLGGTEIGRNLYEEIRGGYTDKMSFGFIVDKDEELRTDAEDGRVDILRTITGISKLFDVSAVSIPANNGTSISATTRSRIDGVIEEVRAERLEAERLKLEKRRTEVRARALGKDVTK